MQDPGYLLKRTTRAPNQPFYEKGWDVPLPESLTQSLQASGRPAAHAEYQKCWDYILGQVPLEPERWRRLNQDDHAVLD